MSRIPNSPHMASTLAFVSGSIPHFSLPMPMDYAAGSVMGAAVGVGWARSFLHHEEDEEPAQAAGRIRPAASRE